MGRYSKAVPGPGIIFHNIPYANLRGQDRHRVNAADMTEFYAISGL